MVPPAALELVVWSGASVRCYPLPRTGSVTLGRADDVHVRIDDASLSRHHATLHLGDRLAITDAGSRNGTRLRTTGDAHGGHTTDLVDERIAAHAPVAIRVGQTVLLGSVAVVVRAVASASDAVDPGTLVVEDDAMRALHALIDRIAPSHLSVLVLGETGTGKEVVAERLHRASPRAPKPLLRLNCASLTGSLLESELFGHERGAFTGAVGTKRGLLEAAAGGTVLLDEIGEMPAATQARLLRVLENRTMLRVGGTQEIAIDVRFVSATHRDLHAEVERGAFRRDLLFRLEGIALTLPPLRARVSEIEPLARLFARRAAAQLGRLETPVFEPAALDALRMHPWPGNVRELRNVVERAVVLSDARIGLDALRLAPERARVQPPPPEPVAPPTPGEPPRALDTVRDELSALERQRVVDALAQCNGNQTRAAAMLGISRRTLVTRLEDYALPRPRKREG